MMEIDKIHQYFNRFHALVLGRRGERSLQCIIAHNHQTAEYSNVRWEINQIKYYSGKIEWFLWHDINLIF